MCSAEWVEKAMREKIEKKERRKEEGGSIGYCDIYGLI